MPDEKPPEATGIDLLRAAKAPPAPPAEPKKEVSDAKPGSEEANLEKLADDESKAAAERAQLTTKIEMFATEQLKKAQEEIEKEEPPKTDDLPDEKIQEMYNEDPIKAVKEQAKREAERMIREQTAKNKTKEEKLRDAKIAAEANKIAYSRFPELLEFDQATPEKQKELIAKSSVIQAYQKAYQDNPNLTRIPDGAKYATYEVERALGIPDKMAKDAEKRGREAEITRSTASEAAASVIGSSSGGPTPPPATPGVKLDANQTAVAAKMRISPEEFAKYAKRGPVLSADYYKKYADFLTNGGKK